MKRKGFPKKMYIFCTILVVFCIAVCFCIVRGLIIPENADSYVEENNIQRQWNLSKIDVQQALCDYDKNIEKVFVSLETSESKIISSNILVISKGKITDADEQDEIRTIVSEYLNLDVQNIYIEYEDSETFFARLKCGSAITNADL